MESTNLSPFRSPLLSGDSAEQFRNLLALPLAQFIRECHRQPLQFSGPGGSRRNRVKTGIRLTHPALPCCSGEAGEAREAERNLESAALRLRLAAAMEQRTTLPFPTTPLPWKRPPISLEHPLYPWFVSLFLDSLEENCGEIAPVAAQLGWSQSALLKQLFRDKQLWKLVAERRQSLELKTLLPPR